MPSLRVRIPDPLRLLLEQRAGSLAAAVKAVVAEALALRPDPLDPPPPSLAATSHVINISDAQLSALAALGSPRG